MKKYLPIIVIVFFISATIAEAAGVLEFISEWSRENDSPSEIQVQYWARLDGVESFCTVSNQLDCDIVGNTTKDDGFEFFFEGNGDGPERIEIQQIQEMNFLLVEDEGFIDIDLLVPSNMGEPESGDSVISEPNTPDIPIQPSLTPIPPSPTPTPIPPSPTPTPIPPTPTPNNPCGHYGPWSTQGPNGPYKCKGGN